MAIGKSKSGSGFKGATSYILGKKDAEFLFGNNVYTTDPEIIAKQMRIAADVRNLKKPVMHFSISLGKGERGSDDQWKKAADAFLKSMGFDLKHTQYFAARHNDTDYDHIHILVNRVQLNNVVVSDFQHKRRVHEATRAAELAAGFKVFESQKERQTRKSDVREKIDLALSNSKGDYQLFKNELFNVGIEVHENRSQTTNRLHGISYKIAEHAYKGSSLGQGYSLGDLEKRGLDAGRTQQKQAGQTHSADAHAPTNPNQTQAIVDAERRRKDAEIAKSRASDNELENKRLQAIKAAEQEDEDEL